MRLYVCACVFPENLPFANDDAEADDAVKGAIMHSESLSLAHAVDLGELVYVSKCGEQIYWSLSVSERVVI